MGKFELVDVKRSVNKGGNRTYKITAERDERRGSWFPMVRDETDGACVTDCMHADRPTEDAAIKAGVQAVREKYWE